MAVITFIGNGEKETGNTSAAIAAATYMSIEHNMKILLISTSLNDDAIKESFWTEKGKNSLSSKGQKNSISSIQSGIEGLTRIISSGKVEPRIIRDYTNVVLAGGRFDVLLGYTGQLAQYREIQVFYPKIIKTAAQFYDMVIVDLDKKIARNVREEIIKVSDLIVATTCQKVKDIQKMTDYLNGNELTNEGNTLILIGRYDDYLKVNAKNVTRAICKRKKLINTMPYNGMYYEAMQEGTVVDLFLKLLEVNNKKDHNYFFLQEVERLIDDINEKWQIIQMKKGM